MRWLAAYLPAFILDLQGRATPTAIPLAVVEGGGGREALTACNEAAGVRGVCPGMSRDTAHALAPELQVVSRDEAAEAAALRNLAAWAGQFSDVVSIEPGQGLILESGRSLRLFGGGRRLGRLVRQGLATLGFEAWVALAPTARGSWWLASRLRGSCIADGETLGRRMAGLPLTVMALSPRALADLQALGLSTVGDLEALPRDGLARRVGAGVLRQLDEALGRRAEVRRPHVPPPRFHGHLDLPAPVLDQQALLFPLRRLLLELSGMLRGQGAGVSRFRVGLDHGGGRATSVDVGLAVADDDGERFLELLRHRLERRELPAPVERVTVDAAGLRPMTPITGDLFDAARTRDERREGVLLDRLAARLGDAAVCGLAPVSDHRPERAWRVVPAAPGRRDVSEVLAHPPRPRWLLTAPRPVAPPGEGPAALRLLRGPERIEGGWWDDDDVNRDYYVAEDRDGRRLWLFRERRPPHGWYVHGLFG